MFLSLLMLVLLIMLFLSCAALVCFAEQVISPRGGAGGREGA
jgi:hypothetical protein